MLEGEFASFLVGRIKAHTSALPTSPSQSELTLYVAELERVVDVLCETVHSPRKRPHRATRVSTSGPPTPSTVGTLGTRPDVTTRKSGASS